MDHLFVLCNQHQHFLTKSGEWNSGEDNRALYRTPHKDEAINQMVELTVKQPELRIQIVSVSQTERGLLKLPKTATSDAEAAAASEYSGTDADPLETGGFSTEQPAISANLFEKVEINEHSLQTNGDSAQNEQLQTPLPSQEQA